MKTIASSLRPVDPEDINYLQSPEPISDFQNNMLAADFRYWRKQLQERAQIWRPLAWYSYILPFLRGTSGDGFFMVTSHHNT